MFEVLIVEEDEMRTKFIESEIKNTLDNKVRCTFAKSEKEAREHNDFRDFHLHLISLLSDSFDGIKLAKYFTELWGTYKINIVFVSHGEIKRYEGLPAYPMISVDHNRLALNNSEVNFKTLLKQLWKLKQNSETPRPKKLEENDRIIGLVTKDKLKFTCLNDLLYIRVVGNELLFFTYDGKHLRVKESLDNLLQGLNDGRICRCQKSLALNLFNVKYLEKVSSRRMRVHFDIMGRTQASECYVSKTYFEDVTFGLEQIRRQTNEFRKEGITIC